MEPPEASLPLRWPPVRSSAADRSVWLALVVAFVLLITTDSRQGGETIASLVPIAVVLAISARWSVAPLAIAALLVVGVGLRAAIQIHFGSDVIDTIASAIRHVEAGANPYGVGYTASRPPGAPFAYGPLALLWYAPLQNDGWQLELVMSGVVMTLLALRGKLLGLAFYAVGPTLVATSGDGSNDTSAGFLILAALVIAERRPRVGAVLLALATAFKPYAAAWLPALALWGGWTVLASYVAASLIAWSPVIFVWGIGNFLKSLKMADDVHQIPYWSLGELWESFVHRSAVRDQFNTFRLALGGAMALVTLRLARSIDGVIVAGALVFVATMYAGFWSSYAYIGAVAPILCWKIDGWLGLRTRPLVRLAGDDEADRRAAAT